ncbi:MAG: DUF488 domain-containing protein [Nitrososphaerota archaeon]|nr:DUF488 domain-containing protein [Candidatus Bathyarchaeota archaeon]MDW8023793.1 DUF488 domain-containing protein [Nitrososphaerota archaeon]
MQITVWTIGHSNRSLENFLELLKGHEIQVLADVRSFPTSKIEHFKKEELEKRLPEHGIEYLWLGRELGGYRRGGYKAHMKTRLFKGGIQKLLEIASLKRTCIMCMELNPKYCHRRFISAHLEKKGVKVVHIITKGQKSLI